MNRKIVLSLLFCFVISLSFVSCERYPITDIHSIPSPVNAWPYPWYIYDDEIQTKGLFAPVMFDDSAHTGDTVPADLDFDWNHGPYRGKACIKFDWYPKNGKTWCGFGLASTEDVGNPHSSKNMETSGYTKLKFFIRGTITSGAKVTIGIPRTDYNGDSQSPIDSEEITGISNDVWVEKTITLNQTKSNWNTQKYYLSVTIEGGSSNGATIYLDDIRFIKD